MSEIKFSEHAAGDLVGKVVVLTGMFVMNYYGLP